MFVTIILETFIPLQWDWEGKFSQIISIIKHAESDLPPENADTGVTCNAICPGWVLTPLVQKQVDARAAAASIPVEQAKRELLLEKQPSGEFVTPEQLGALAVFLCSDAAAQVRGVAWNMDGGWVAQ